ncbi:FeoA family protein [Deinococcus rhizophilus]
MAAGLTPGAALTLTRVDPALGTLTLTLAGGSLTLALAVAAQVHVHGGAE